MTSSADARRTIPATGRRGGLALPLSGILLAQFVASLSATIVATALPSIYADLHTPSAASTWIVAATVLGNAVSVPIWGGIGDRVRPRTVLQSAVLLFGVASLVAGTASGTAVLIAGRALQGVALGGLFSLGAVVVAGLTTPRERGRVNAWTATAQTVATVIGPTLGGLVVQSDRLGWRWCFFLGLPVTITAVVVIGLTIRRGTIAAVRPQRDVLGAVLVGTAITLLLVAVSLSADAGRALWWITGTGAAGVAATVAMVLVELRAPAPVLPVRLLRDPVVGRCAAGAFLTGTGLFSGTVFVSQFLQTGAGLSPTASGLVLLPGALVAVSVSFAAGRYMGRTGRVRPVLAVAAGLLVLGHASLAVAGSAPVP
ncbi:MULTISPECIES: MFS transporter, partial [Curtobacterium]|uniref:MFS transporter n=1 Tax=Curtobacterium flaccumfaciens TaxID=2035 RepID=UPI003EE4D329